jgi:NADPH:quinone reductase-like Zn-dependent oxidoreductase
VRLDTAALKPTEVLVQMLAAPITSVDLAQIAGSASFPSAPSGAATRVCGNEGLGIVLEAGSGAGGLKKGDLVAPSLGGQGTWATHVLASGEAWTRVGTDAAAMGAVESVAAGIAPTLVAQRLLSDFVQLKSGAWAAARAQPPPPTHCHTPTLSHTPAPHPTPDPPSQATWLC